MRKQTWNFFAGLTIGMAGLVVGCKSEPPLPKVDCATVSPVPTYGQVTIFEVCNQCHSTTKTGSQRHDADGDINYNTFADAKKDAEGAAREVNGGDMPPSNPGIELRAITADEKTALYEWALCGTPE
jgi:uncharacterized membrane protein